MDRSARRWLAYLVVTPLGLMPLGGCGNSTVEPTAQVEAARGIPPLLLPRVDSPRSLGDGSNVLAAHTTLVDRVVVSESPRRLPPIEDLAGNVSSNGVMPDMRIASVHAAHGNYENFKIIPLPPVTESYGPGDAVPYLASLPQSVVVPPRTEASPAAEGESVEPDMPDLTWPSDVEEPATEEAAAKADAQPQARVEAQAEVEDLAPVPDTVPQLDADLKISEPIESAELPELNKTHEASVASPDSTFVVQPLPPVAPNEIKAAEPALVQVPGKGEEFATPAVPSISPAPAQPAEPVLSERAKAMRVVSEQAAVHVRRGMSLAGRNAHYSARSEFIQALRLISQALDVANDSHEYTEALSNGLRALDEADDFVPRGTQLEADLNIALLIRSHRTPALKEADPKSLRPIFARQEYYNYAQKQLAHCAEGDRSGSMALYGLAKMRASMAAQQQDVATLELPKAMALYQAAMLIDGDNYMASNELGVLLARYGQYESASLMLEHSVRVQPQPTSWHNLAVVYHQLGKKQESQFAQNKHLELVQAQRTSKKPSGAVEWKSVEDFNRSTARSQAPVAQTPAKTASNAAAEKSSEKK